MKKSKINVITYYDEANYGAFLQAYALQKYLESEGFDANIYEYSKILTKMKAKIYSILKPNKALKGEKYLYNKALHQTVLDLQNYLSRTNDLKCDFTIIGSDEIWNIRNFCAPHNSLFFTRNNKSKRTISFAACCGNSTKKDFKLRKRLMSGLKSLDSYSVRDESTYNLVKSIGINNVTRVMDPTFLFDFNSFIEKDILDQEYILIYSYGISKEHLRQIKKLANEENLKIIFTGSYCENVDENPVPNAFEWLKLIKNAKYIFTTTFHGTVFSIQLQKDFYVLNNESKKVNNVLNEFNLLDRNIKSIDSKKLSKIDYRKVNMIKNELTEKSKKFLLDNLK